MDILRLIEKRKNWWRVFFAIFVISIAVVGYIGYKTYKYAPPIADMRAPDGETVFTARDIQLGQQRFFRYGLMEYGSFLGDGGLRGPDFTAEALNLTARWMNELYGQQWRDRLPNAVERERYVRALVQDELKANGYDPVTNTVTLSVGQADAARKMVTYYAQKFGEGGDLVGIERFKPDNYITNQQHIRELTAFLYWGGWLAAAKRPGYDYSYTHNWPFDPVAGNTPTAGIMMWSIIGALVLMLSLGMMLYVYGRIDRESVHEAQLARTPPLATAQLVDRSQPTATQRAAYKFLAVAAVLFLVQVTAGLLAIGDFVNLFGWTGLDITAWYPVTVTRAWHTQMSVLWIAVCWFAGSIWTLPMMSRPEPAGQLQWVNGLFWMLVVVAVGAVVGIPAGINGLLDTNDAWRWFGLQGWEFMEIGRIYQYLLYAAFVVWFIIVVRGLWPLLRLGQTWSLPNWMTYAIAGIIFMFTAGFVTGPDTSFVIGDFWRWVVIHMWVEAFFELFTTILVSYFLYLMGFVSHAVASRVVYLAAVLFLGSGLIGISHNFYWNAKSIETVALGGVLSTLQVAPLLLLTIEAWRFRNLPGFTMSRQAHAKDSVFGLPEAFLFLIAVNFWNFFGAGVLGFMINLPIVNYYQHGTYLTVNHGHAALFGVYGNLAIATMLFCARWVVEPSRWNATLLRASFWSLNMGLALMVVLDLFPVGINQLMTVMEHGYAFARSQAYIDGDFFQNATWLRGIGVTIFIVGGVLPLVWFMVTRWGSLKAVDGAEDRGDKPDTLLKLNEPALRIR
jgi:nitric oxide reductase subunit B